ncbi:hypothetical protein C8Q76DRAFT_617395, partial [Earliella scabrosa]
VQDLILRLVMAHLQDRVPQVLSFEDPRYTLRAEHAAWSFGKKVRFQWGDEHLEACADKWTFTLTPTLGSASSHKEEERIWCVVLVQSRMQWMTANFWQSS